MLKAFSLFILRLIGWKLDIVLPKEKKFVLIGAPHTSNWDFPLALLAFWTLDIKICWLAKQQLFRGPFHYLFTALGGIPVDRSAPQGIIHQLANRFRQSNELVLTIAPEGTRSKTRYWKSGFYYIALEADVPVYLGYIDYGKKALGFNKRLKPAGDIDTDMKTIAAYYQGITGKHPDKQGIIQIRKKD